MSKSDSSGLHYVSPDGDQPITPAECNLVREGVDLGVSIETIADRLERSTDSLLAHARGECWHVRGESE